MLKSISNILEYILKKFIITCLTFGCNDMVLPNTLIGKIFSNSIIFLHVCINTVIIVFLYLLLINTFELLMFSVCDSWLRCQLILRCTVVIVSNWILITFRIPWSRIFLFSICQQFFLNLLCWQIEIHFKVSNTFVLT